MKVRTKLPLAVLGLAALFTARPGATFTLVEKSGFNAHMTLSQTGFCDGSVRTRLEPGAYDVRVSTFADGSVHAVLSQGGIRKGETRAVSAPGTNEVLIGLLLPAINLPAINRQVPAGAADGTKIKN